MPDTSLTEESSLRIAYLDCFAGISGDMFLGAILDAGVPMGVLQDAIAALGLGASLKIETVDRSGISYPKLHVCEGGSAAEADTPTTTTSPIRMPGPSRILTSTGAR